ncbi:2502_t:CDS:2 [Cetraspora pellucida]|uniref:2502_t:CDS:1 n=1 Tax=Cetraspora pellucida TaxID=1433469 RepID=A0A9N9J0U7_9GLOM|nr:2502_t:CDS:2 [Cetraspora pellucida]
MGRKRKHSEIPEISKRPKYKKQLPFILNKRSSIFNFTEQFESDDPADCVMVSGTTKCKLSLEDKNHVYLLTMKKLLESSDIDIIEIKKNRLIGKYRSLTFFLKTLYNEPWVFLYPKDVKEFMKEMNEAPKGLTGYLVSSNLISKECIEKSKKYPKVWLSHENDIIELIKNMENRLNNCSFINKLETYITSLENTIDLQGQLIENQTKIIDVYQDMRSLIKP